MNVGNEDHWCAWLMMEVSCPLLPNAQFTILSSDSRLGFTLFGCLQFKTKAFPMFLNKNTFAYPLSAHFYYIIYQSFFLEPKQFGQLLKLFDLMARISQHPYLLYISKFLFFDAAPMRPQNIHPSMMSHSGSTETLTPEEQAVLMKFRQEKMMKKGTARHR